MSKIEFPRDERVHAEGVEWWYWNGHLKDVVDEEYVFMVALFKTRLPGVRPIWIMHDFVSSFKSHKFDSRI